MEPTDNTGEARPLGPHAAQILATEHWSLLGTRALIWNEEFKLVLAMNRLRHAYLTIEPGLEPYFTTGHYDDERGLVATYMLDHPSRRWLLVHFVINTPTIVATVDAALAAAIAVLVLQAAGAATTAVVAVGVVAFVVVWGGLMPLQRHTVDPLRHGTPRFPTAPQPARPAGTPGTRAGV